MRSKKEKKRVKQRRTAGMKNNTTLDRFFVSGKRTISEEANSSDTESKHSTLLFVGREGRK